MLDLASIARTLGGEVSGGQVLCPGPGHSAEDRSLSVKCDSAAPEGFVVHSFSGDDPIVCRDYVRTKLGLSEFEPRSKRANGGTKPFSPTVAKYVYRLADGTPYLQVHRLANKSGFPQYHWDGEKWVSGKPKGPKIPYLLPKLATASPTTPIYIVEGEKDVDNLTKIGFTATCNSEGADNGKGGKWTPELNQYFKDRHVYIIPDNDAQGRTHAQHVACQLHLVAASVRIVELPNLPLKGDVSDWLRSDSAGAKLARLAAAAPLWEPSADKIGATSDEELIAGLAELPRLDYARRRKDMAEALGIRVGELDKIVALARGESKKPAAPPLYKHWNVEPADEPVDGGALLRAIKETIQSYIFMSEEQATAVTLWVAFSWLHEHESAVTHSPILFVTSAEKDSGKTTLLGVLNFLTRRSLQSVEISGAALFRSIEKWQPTLIVDEADDTLANNSDLRSVINSGWTRGQGVIRCHPETHEPQVFSSFAPKIVSMKGRSLEAARPVKPIATSERSIAMANDPIPFKAPKAPPADADDIEALFLDPALGDGLTDQVYHSIPVGKPKDFFRVCPLPAYRRRTELYVHKVEGQIEEQSYIVAPSMRGKITEARSVTLVVCIHRDGSLRLWALKHPNANEKDNEAWVSARAAARTAMDKWVKLLWVRRSYVTREALPGYAPDPDYSKLPPFDEIVRLAFGAHGIIRDETHPIYRELFGLPANRADGDGDDL